MLLSASCLLIGFSLSQACQERSGPQRSNAEIDSLCSGLSALSKQGHIENPARCIKAVYNGTAAHFRADKPNFSHLSSFPSKISAYQMKLFFVIPQKVVAHLFAAPVPFRELNLERLTVPHNLRFLSSWPEAER
jgi:hypothetical protein